MEINRNRSYTAVCALLALTIPFAGTASAAAAPATPVASGSAFGPVLEAASPPVITSPAVLAVLALGGTINHRYTATGDPQVTWSITGRLPAGITFDPATGVLSGRATSLLALNLGGFTVTARNSLGSASQSGSVIVALGGLGSPPPSPGTSPVITSPAPIGVTVASSYSHQFAASGTPAPRWSVTTGNLPAGLTLDPTTGLLSGTPAATVGAYLFTVTASNAAGSASQLVTLVVALGTGGTGGTGGGTGTPTPTPTPTPAPTQVAPEITSQPPGGATVGQPYRHDFTATGTPAPTWSVASGTLPAGLGLDPTTGALSGTPTQAGTSSFTVRASNAAGQQDQVVTVTTVADTPTGTPTGPVATAPQIASPAPPAGTVGVAYEHRFDATGTPQPTWGVSSGALPAGLSLDAATGVLSGTPTTAASSAFTVTATNGAGSDDQRASVTIVAAGQAPVLSVPFGGVIGTTGEPLTTRVSATGSPAPVFAVEGALPAGLSLDPVTGVISGTPTTAGSGQVVVTATNPSGTGRLTVRFDITAATTATDPAAGTTRLDGEDRVTTAIDVSRTLFPGTGSARSVVISTSTTYADAMGGGRLAAAHGGPLLLTSPAGLEASVAAEVRRALPSGGRIFVLGGASALSPAVEDSLRSLGGYSVERLAGADRFETAALTADRVVAATGASSPATVYLADGLNFPDGLAVSALASRTGGVVLLTRGGALPDPTRAYIARHDPDGADTIPVGGPAATAARALPAATASAATDNAVVGEDRYDTAARIAVAFTTGRAATAGDADVVGLATGLNWPDALVGAAALGHLGGPLLLTPTDRLHPTVQAAVAELHADKEVRSGLVFGGEAAVRSDVHDGFAALIAAGDGR